MTRLGFVPAARAAATGIFDVLPFHEKSLRLISLRDESTSRYHPACPIFVTDTATLGFMINPQPVTGRPCFTTCSRVRKADSGARPSFSSAPARTARRLSEAFRKTRILLQRLFWYSPVGIVSVLKFIVNDKIIQKFCTRRLSCAIIGPNPLRRAVHAAEHR